MDKKKERALVILVALKKEVTSQRMKEQSGDSLEPLKMMRI